MSYRIAAVARLQWAASNTTPHIMLTCSTPWYGSAPPRRAGLGEDLDLAAIENVSAKYLDEGHGRSGDMAWKVYSREDALANRRRP